LNAFYRVDGLQRRIGEWNVLRQELERLHGKRCVSPALLARTYRAQGDGKAGAGRGIRVDSG